MAKNAGLTTRQGAQGAMTWARPRADAARSWAAPRIERAGLAVRDRIAPRISAMLVTAAHRLDTTPRRVRRWPKRLAGTATLAAAASAAAAVIMRRHPAEVTEPPSPDAMVDSGASVNGETASSAASGGARASKV
jgi:hypothetical protein